MQFNRDVFPCGKAAPEMNTVSVHHNFTNFLANCGFVNKDNTPVDMTTPLTEAKWKYDTFNDRYTQFIKSYPNISGISATVWVYEKDIGITVNVQDNRITPDYDTNMAIFFIPLKNNGFIMSSYGTSYPYGTPNPNTPTLNSLTYNATPPESSLVLQRVTSGLIGFFNNVNNTFNYISKENGLSTINPATSNYYNIRWDKGNDTGRSSILPNIIDYDGRYTDVKQGVCTLIRVPFSNGFLSNLYLVNTAPRQGVYQTYTNQRIEIPNDAYGVDDKFFSFGGRNFYGIGYNMVVELPSN